MAQLSTQDVVAGYKHAVLETYTRQPLVIVKAKGSRVWDIEGHEYLDVFPGWGVGGLGHCHPWVMKAIRGQSTKLIHVPNNYYHVTQLRLAKKLIDSTFDGGVFFANSGAEVVEAAIKLARRFGRQAPGADGRPSPGTPRSGVGEGSAGGREADGPRHEIIVMERSFHGRTTGALSATAQPKHQEGFAPLLPGFVTIALNDAAALRRAITPRTVAILLEPIQGEGGIHIATNEFLREARALADQHNLLVIFDEVQTGMGRTGSLFAYQQTGITPDVLLLAKALGGGVPIGAMVVGRKLASILPPGSHGSTYGGNPLACAAALAVFEAIEKQELLARAAQFGALIAKRLEALRSRCPIIREIRSRGLMIGIELSVDGRPIVDACRAKRLLINCTQERVLRLLPALTITRSQLDQALHILEEVLMAQVPSKVAA